MKKLEIYAQFLLFVLLSFSPGCIAWEPGWTQAKMREVEVDVRPLLERAMNAESGADTREKVLHLIELYESVLALDPYNPAALSRLGGHCFLMAYGYGSIIYEKEKYYIKSVQYSERLLYLNKDFKSKVDGGASLWDALDVLTRDDMTGLWWLYISSGNCWKECFNKAEQFINVIWLLRNKKILERMMEIDPEWQNGSPYYLRGTYCCEAPSIAGGDLRKADALFKKAVELGPMMLNFRRTRARFLYTKTGDREAFIRDMEWVISQDPRKAPLGYPLNFFIKHDARQGLADVEKYFK